MMYSSVIREGDIVQTPLGRRAIVIGWLKDKSEQAYRFVEVAYEDSPDETFPIRPRLLRHISSRHSGQSLDVILSDEQATPEPTEHTLHLPHAEPTRQ